MMAKLYFKFGAMGSSKTANALMTRFNYIEKGRNVLLLKPSVDTRDGKTTIGSRIGLSAEADVVYPDTNIEDFVFERNKSSKTDVIIVDECQFLTKEQVYQLKNISSFWNIPVLCYGLRTNYKLQLFEGSKALFELADSISEIKSICSCGEKAIINARIDENGNVITTGDEIDIGGNEKYTGMCYKCWKKALNQNPNSVTKNHHTVEFISYDGEYPNLCSGTVVLNIDGKKVFLPNILVSGGCINLDSTEEVIQHPWKIRLSLIPNKYKPLIKQIEDVVNANIPWGCCGGCL